MQHHIHLSAGIKSLLCRKGFSSNITCGGIEGDFDDSFNDLQSLSEVVSHNGALQVARHPVGYERPGPNGWS